jgi:hypothetical protein
MDRTTDQVEGLRATPHRRAQPKIIQVSVPKAMIERMEAHRMNDTIPVTKTAWILQAMSERLDRLEAAAKAKVKKNAR